MSQYSQLVLIGGMVQMCGGAPSSEPVGPYGFSCDDYQLMIDVELDIGQGCNTDADCTQDLISGDAACPSNTVVVNDDYNTTYFYDLYDEAIDAGCAIELDINQDCSATDLVCWNAQCTWR